MNEYVIHQEEETLTQFSPGQKVRQEVNGDRVIGWQVGLGINGQEGVDLALRLVLGAKLGCRDMSNLRNLLLSVLLNIVAAVHL